MDAEWRPRSVPRHRRRLVRRPSPQVTTQRLTRSYGVNETSLTRRLLAGVAGFGVGVMGAVALVTPAEATDPEPTAVVSVEDTCEGTKVTIDAGGTSRNWRILAGGETVWGTFDDPPVAHSPDSDTGWLTGENQASYLVAAEDAVDVTVQWWRHSKGVWATDEVDTIYHPDAKPHNWSKPEECEKKPKPKASYELLPLIGCDLLVFAIRNDSEEKVDLTMSLTPDRDTKHGHAPAFLPLLDADPDEDGFLEEPEDAELVDEQEISAGETVGPLGPFGQGEAHAHGFVAVEGLTVTVEIAKVVHSDKGDKKVVLETSDVTWDPKDLKCDED